MTALTQSIKLLNGLTVPVLGLGTWKSKPGEVKAAVEHAIDCGYRHIDCAFIYGNEKEIGEAFAKKFSEGIERKDLFITSKLWNTCHAAADVLPALTKTLKDLQLTYLDLYLIHWPTGWKAGDGTFPRDANGDLVYSDTHYKETWPELEKAVDNGLVKSIGFSNFNSKQVTDVCSFARIKPAMNQVEIHPYLIQKELIAHCHDLGVKLTAYSPLGSSDRPWAKPEDPSLLEDPKLIAIGKKYNKSPAQICIRWQIQRGLCVIPKSSNPERIKQNSEVFDFELSGDDMVEIETFNRPWRSCLPKIVKNGVSVPRDDHHPHYPFNEPF